jgi:PAS domain S-box-containing protein
MAATIKPDQETGFSVVLPHRLEPPVSDVNPAPASDGVPQPAPVRSELELLRERNAMLEKLVSDRTVDSRLAAIIESSDDAIVSKTLQGIILTWNRGAERIFGWKAHEVIGKAINILIPPDRQEEEPQILARLHRGERVDHFETVRVTKDGRLIDVSVSISPVRDIDDRIVAASKIARDITLQKRIQRELQLAKEAAEAANHAKDQFLSILSHELRTPLTPVLAEMSYLETLEDLPEAIRSNISMIRRNVETEARLVDDLLDLTRIARGMLQLRCEVVDVNDAIRSVIAMVQNQIDAKRIELAVGLRARKHHVWADAGRLQQILLNLFSNAVKFTNEGGAISIRTSNEQADHQLQVEVADNGIGIEPEVLPRLFNAFEQTERTRRFGGLGLGLSIARSLATLHHGTIQAVSEGHDKGSTFVFSLSTTAPPSERPQPVPVATTAKKLSGFRVLLVEDHTDTRAAMARLLQALGCTVTLATSVREAVAIASHAAFDLLISDIGLPDGSGIDVMRSLREQNIRGIALSGFGQEEDVQRSRDAGFETHMTKPINFQTLRELVSKYADQK